MEAVHLMRKDGDNWGDAESATATGVVERAHGATRPGQQTGQFSASSAPCQAGRTPSAVSTSPPAARGRDRNGGTRKRRPVRSGAPRRRDPGHPAVGRLLTAVYRVLTADRWAHGLSTTLMHWSCSFRKVE